MLHSSSELVTIPRLQEAFYPEAIPFKGTLAKSAGCIKMGLESILGIVICITIDIYDLVHVQWCGFS